MFGVACVAAILTGTLVVGSTVLAADQRVAVVRFYAISPVTTYSGIDPEQYASDRLSARLAALAGPGQLAIVPRGEVQVEESALRWRESDVLRFARLEELAHATNANRLVVGWIRQFTIDHLGGGPGELDVGGGEGGGLTMGSMIIQVQIFDAAQSRVVYQTEVAGHGMGAITVDVVRDTIDNAVGRAAADLAAPLAAP